MKASQLNIKVEVDTDVMSLKLRAVAKHALALADDLDKIGSATCKECGGLMTITEYGLGDEVIETTFNCEQCEATE